MARYFTQIWARSHNDWLAKDEVRRGESLNHTAGNQFKRQKVRSGDFIYVVTVEDQQLYLIGRLQVDRICSQQEAERILKTTNLWLASQHAIAKPGTELPMRSDLAVPLETAEGLPFVTKQRLTRLGPVNGRKLQAMRELTEDSAKALDELLQSSREIDFSLPEEVEDNEVHYEGAVHRISVNAYERSSEARRKCIAHYGVHCCVCRFDFSEVYGRFGQGLIHVHHLRQLSEIGAEYKVDPIQDLRPVCPNCHAIIHRRKPHYSLEEVQAMLKSQSNHSKHGS